MARYIQRIDGEGWIIKNRIPFRISCCDCGLVHDLVVALSSKRRGMIIGIAAKRNNRATAAKRRGKEQPWRPCSRCPMPSKREGMGTCRKCEKEPANWVDGYCVDCWPGYNLCADPKCDHYRCEHGDDDCGNYGCDCKGFTEGSLNRIVTRAEFAELRKSWGKPE